MRDETGEWLASAQEDLDAARVLFDAGQYHAMAQHAQQTAEKALKALLVEQTGELPARTHDLRRIGTQVGVPPELLARLVELYAYYLAGRYPGAGHRDAQAVTAEAETALGTGRDALAWAHERAGAV